MAHRGMEKRIAGIIRWLERFQSSYRSGALESALMDAECARADLDDLRSDVWEKVGASHAAKRARRAALCRLAALVLLGVLTAPSPLSREEGLFLPPDSGGTPMRATVEATPGKLDLQSPSAAAPGKDAAASPPSAPRRVGRTGARSPAVRSGTSAEQRSSAAELKQEKSVPYDKMFLLLETGVRALKDGESAIKVDKERRN